MRPMQSEDIRTRDVRSDARADALFELVMAMVPIFLSVKLNYCNLQDLIQSGEECGVERVLFSALGQFRATSTTLGSESDVSMFS